MAKWRRRKEYRVWRVKVIRRDGCCVICGTRKSRQAHHLDHAMYFKEKRYDVDNGVTLCRWCHINFHTNFKRSFRVKSTKYDFENFKVLMEYAKDIYSN